ncbi:FtsK/SpoIIIE domain-containing protein [Mycobacteroides abscessus]|uniref:FtsK/SpoIIIE domain-containing protein n=2 Tax=Mycobacteroides abscessus TaxID=36809 RepID=UPI000926BCCD|nr:FtsK/SpoIIIE domain-containing protein [Mycobacteroides abscessus]SHQ51102.1 DNA segregation ATPase, FtsK/SpoIIIE family [Mycobacteroides abscessus subsp. abscessus]SKQ82813.1 DNA segregation ATPase, FtsK/SpoIIIE family [Mycobacteroides abscessus subsp. massiliense]SLC50261.1 DNA segregation ATPase, FtsK/SpoIIIE family [Mycobacteroides abscessus subsp. massiliense]
MSTVEYAPRELALVPPTPSDIVIASPLKREEKGKTSPMKIILGLAGGALMIFFLILMFVIMGRQPNPMMLMGYTMMAAMVIGGAFSALMQVIGGGDEDLDRKRQNIDLQLAESAIDVHETASEQHAFAMYFHPNPANIQRLVEKRDRTFWSGDLSSEAHTAMLRIGIGTAQLEANLTSKDSAGVDEAQEHLYEEYSSVAVSRFRSMMSVVPEVPLVREMNAPAYGFRGGDQERINGLIRSALLSATFKYSPNKVLVGVISRNTKEWGWTKWLPHSRNRLREPGPSGYQQLAWRDYDTFLKDMSGHFDSLSISGTRMYVVVDDPDLTLRWPAEYIEGIPGLTFLAANVRSDAHVTTRKHRIRVDGDRLKLHQADRARADYVSRYDAELTARAMAPIRPEGFGFNADQQPAAEPQAAPIDVSALPTIMEHLGIGDVDDFDLKGRVWDATEYAETLESMFGYVLDENNKPTGELATLDLFEEAGGGTGPHGMMSGGTGTGKSFMMTALVLGLILANSPTKLRLIMADFKGGATWKRFQGRIAHEAATITNLDNALDLLERTKEALLGEVKYRQVLFSRYPDVENIRDYRMRCRTHPEMEPLPYLLFIADEVHEFLHNHPEYRAIFEHLGRIGRSLGVLVFLASQYLEERTVGDFVDHAKFGLSLKVKKPNQSKTVLKGNDVAIRLPESMVAMFCKTVNKQDTIYQRVMAWNWQKRYKRPLKREEVLTAPGQPSVVAQAAEVHTEDVAEFGMYHRPAEQESVEPEAQIEAVPVQEAAETDMSLVEAGIRLVERCGKGYRSRELWTEPLRHPLSLWHVRSGWQPEPGKLQLRIGDIDVPFYAKRTPMVVEFTGAHSNAMIAGGGRTGKTNTVRAMIAASAQTYPADYASWYIYDYAGMDLACMSTWPNVGGYAAKTDEDMFARLWGEINRIIDLRSKVIGANRSKIRTIEQYLSNKEALGVTHDPYGHIFFVVDGLDRILEDAGPEYVEPRDKWLRLLSRGPSVGVHIVYTTRDTGGRMPKIVEKSEVRVFHNMEDPTVMDSTVRNAIRAIPIWMPGGSINADQVDSENKPQILKTRVFVPIPERIQPDRETDGMLEFDIRDYSDRIEETGAQKRATASTFAPQINEVPNVVPFANLIDAYKNIDFSHVGRGTRRLPMGVDRASGQALSLDLQETRHMFVAGTGHAGVTTALRTAINSITSVYTAEEASIILIDGRMGLLDMVESLQVRGYMQEGRFASNTQAAAPFIHKIADVMERRKAAAEAAPPMQLRDRAYVTGKEIFVVIDGFDTLRDVQTGASAEGSLEWLGPKIPVMDVGVHLFVGTEGSGMPSWVGTNKFTKSLSVSPSVRNVILNGNPGEGKIFAHEKVKFQQMPAGRAIWHGKGGSSEQIIQIANSEALI